MTFDPNGRLGLKLQTKDQGYYGLSITPLGLSQEGTGGIGGYPDGWSGALNAVNAAQTSVFGLKLERHAKNGTSGAITYKTLLNDTQAGALKLKFGPDTRAAFGQFIQAMPDDLDANGSLALSLGYQQFDTSETFFTSKQNATLGGYL